MWIRSLCLAVAGLLAGFAASACTDEEKSYSCDAWCAADLSDLVTVTVSAKDGTDAANQCFAAFNCNDMPGRLLKCKCDPL